MAEKLTEKEAILHFVAEVRKRAETLKVEAKRVQASVRAHEMVLFSAGAQLEIFEEKAGSPADNLDDLELLAEDVVLLLGEIEDRVVRWLHTP